MAQSASHQLGELIGNFFEETFKTPMNIVVKKDNLYLDTIGPRGTRKGTKITWTDKNGSKHDLDYVVEKGGTYDKIGEPVAFIELAWRRYTKHSKNKAQEISGAVIPIAEKYADLCPFKGAILGGDFTQNSIDQLRNAGFSVLYIPMKTVVDCFNEFGVDISYDEKTSENDFIKKVNSFNSIPDLNIVSKRLLELCKDDFNLFINDFDSYVNRSIDNICIIPLYGDPHQLKTIETAIQFMESYEEKDSSCSFAYYQVFLSYKNGSKIEARFNTKNEVILFLRRNS